MLQRLLEPEVMDTPAEAIAYDDMDHAEVNRQFVADLLAITSIDGEVLDLGAGTARIPIEERLPAPRPWPGKTPGERRTSGKSSVG